MHIVVHLCICIHTRVEINVQPWPQYIHTCITYCNRSTNFACAHFFKHCKMTPTPVDQERHGWLSTVWQNWNWSGQPRTDEAAAAVCRGRANIPTSPLPAYPLWHKGCLPQPLHYIYHPWNWTTNWTTSILCTTKSFTRQVLFHTFKKIVCSQTTGKLMMIIRNNMIVCVF